MWFWAKTTDVEERSSPAVAGTDPDNNICFFIEGDHLFVPSRVRRPAAPAATPLAPSRPLPPMRASADPLLPPSSHRSLPWPSHCAYRWRTTAPSSAPLPAARALTCLPSSDRPPQGARRSPSGCSSACPGRGLMLRSVWAALQGRHLGVLRGGGQPAARRAQLCHQRPPTRGAP